MTRVLFRGKASKQLVPMYSIKGTHPYGKTTCVLGGGQSADENVVLRCSVCPQILHRVEDDLDQGPDPPASTSVSWHYRYELPLGFRCAG